MAEELDYEQDMRIDETALDVEWLEQPQLAVSYGQHVAGLRREVNRLEEQKKIRRSELIQEANEDPKGTVGKDKPNAADIEAYYRRDKGYQEIVDDLLSAQYDLEMAEVAKNEIAFTRKAALENLVRLHGQQYFAGPSVPRDLSKERQEQARDQSVNKNVKTGRRRNRK
jgi:hypothetical protein